LRLKRLGHSGTSLAAIRLSAVPTHDSRDNQRRRRLPRNLVSDTALRRARGALTSAVHRADDALARLLYRKRRILFEAATPMSIAVFRPVYDQLCRDERLEFWFTSCDSSWTTAEIFGAAGITERLVDWRTAQWMKVDAYVNADFWNMTWVRRRTARIHLFHGVAGKYDLDMPVRIAPIVRSFDRLCFPNRDRLMRYAAAGLVDPDGPAAALVGYPKVDCLVDGSLDRAAIQQAIGLNPGRPTVLYAPTWSPHSSLHSIGEDVITALAALDVNVLVKLHDRSYDPAARGSGGVDWRARLERLRQVGHVFVASEADASPYLFVADVLVTDHSSVGFEFMLLDRPVVVLDCPTLVEQARINADKVALLRSAADVAADAASAAALVKSALDTPARHSARRREIAGTLFHGAGTAAVRAARCIYDAIALPLPDTLAAAAASPDDHLIPRLHIGAAH
jgi:hypothetical protein